MKTIEIADLNEQEIRQLGADIAMILQPGDMLALSGDLGAGKSVMSRAIVQHLAGDPELEVASPTYTLCNLYETTPKLAHFDLYRLSSIDEMEELGIDDALETGCAIVEWPERGFEILPPGAAQVTFASKGGDTRDLSITGSNGLLGRIGRTLAIREFLLACGFPDALRTPFSADASSRRYERICTASGDRYYLMDAPAAPDGEPVRAGKPYSRIAHLAEDVSAFVAIGHLLGARGLGAPQIPFSDIASGLVLIEDMGSALVLDSNGQPDAYKYRVSVEYLANLHQQRFDTVCNLPDGSTYRIPSYDKDAMLIEVELLLDWYAPAFSQSALTETQRHKFRKIWSALFEKLASAERSLVLRDFHSPNIIWRPDRAGTDRIGVIDFQDAVLGPTAYDVASLIQDARVDVPADMQNDLLRRYLDVRKDGNSDFDEAGFLQAFAIMAAQRATKILGIFVRLNERDGKPQYLKHLPRLQAYLAVALDHPVLGDYRQWLGDVMEL